MAPMSPWRRPPLIWRVTAQEWDRSQMLYKGTVPQQAPSRRGPSTVEIAPPTAEEVRASAEAAIAAAEAPS